MCSCSLVSPTFAQGEVAFGLVAEALAASVTRRTDLTSGRNVTAGSGHPRGWARKSECKRDRDEKREGKEGKRKERKEEMKKK